MVEASLKPYTTVSLQVGKLTLSARRWGRGRPVLALHGWMDNCASFDPLAAALEGCDLVCLDFAGHGLSCHRLHLGAYNLLHDVADVFGVADQLGWQRFSLLGHSRGAACAFLAAGTFPERISELILLDGISPMVAEPADAPDLLAESILTVTAAISRPRRYYSSFEQAVRARVKGFIPIAPADAAILAEHGVSQDSQGFFWNHDPKVAAVSEFRLTRKQVDAFAARVEAPIHLFLAEDGLVLKNAELMAWLQRLPGVVIQQLRGGHHFHMLEQGEVIAQQIPLLWDNRRI